MSIAAAGASPRTPNRRWTPDWGLFLRTGFASPDVEPYEFTDIDRTVAIGTQIAGRPWTRPDDTVGVAGILNDISASHEAFLNAGGLGLLIGDGRLPHPGPEAVLEAYYCVAIAAWRVTFDYQFFNNPAYNRDRGPVSVAGLRLHSEFDRWELHRWQRRLLWRADEWRRNRNLTWALRASDPSPLEATPRRLPTAAARSTCTINCITIDLYGSMSADAWKSRVRSGWRVGPLLAPHHLRGFSMKATELLEKQHREIHSIKRFNQQGAVGWGLLWLLGVPVPVLIVFFLLRGCT